MAQPLNPAQRQVIAEKLMELGNLGAAAMVVGQFVVSQGFNGWLFLFGIVFFLNAYLIGIALMRGGEV
jgi:hypothetical protein